MDPRGPIKRKTISSTRWPTEEPSWAAVARDCLLLAPDFLLAGSQGLMERRHSVAPWRGSTEETLWSKFRSGSSFEGQSPLSPSLCWPQPSRSSTSDFVPEDLSSHAVQSLAQVKLIFRFYPPGKSQCSWNLIKDFCQEILYLAFGENKKEVHTIPGFNFWRRGCILGTFRLYYAKVTLKTTLKHLSSLNSPIDCREPAFPKPSRGCWWDQKSSEFSAQSTQADPRGFIHPLPPSSQMLKSNLRAILLIEFSFCNLHSVWSYKNKAEFHMSCHFL